MPSMASDSCHITSGCSGLPKLRQLTSASGSGPDAGQVQHRLGDRHGRARPGIDGTPAVVAVGGESEAPTGVARRSSGCFSRSTVASPPGPSTVLRNSWWSYWDQTHDVSVSMASRSAPGSAQAQVDAAGRRRLADRPARPAGGRTAGRPRAATTAGTSASTSPSKPSRMRSRPPSVTRPITRRRDLPRGADGEHLVEVVGLDDGQHALLGLAGHDLERLHARLRGGGRRTTSTSMPTPPLDGRLAGGAGEAGAAQVLDADHEAGVEQLEARLDEPLLLERVADLHARPLVAVVLVVVEAGRRQHAHAADAVAAGRRAQQDGEVADAARLGEHQAVGRQQAEAEHVDERDCPGRSGRTRSRRRRSARRRSCRSRRCPTRPRRRSSGCGRRRADRSAAGPSGRSGGRPS